MDPLLEIDNQIFNELKKDLGDDFLLGVLDVYHDDARKQLKLLESALGQGDSTAFMEAAHLLKSTSLIFGALAFGNLARDLELLGLAGNIADSREKLTQLQRACDALHHVLKDLCHVSS
ncbi:MAG: Hpt domain-containing protein [Brevefilum sp.]|nr:Hpt domain-containing protein [Brevefilum sp.]